MAKCTHCGSETELYSSGVPICVTCSHDRDSKRKICRARRKEATAGSMRLLWNRNHAAYQQCASMYSVRGFIAR